MWSRANTDADSSTAGGMIEMSPVRPDITAVPDKHEIEMRNQIETNAALREGKGEAIQAETYEHQMTLIEAVKMYPKACFFWAFVISSVITLSVP
ncbi:hypothetical protein JCM24511_08149 [Saitozyma sp. JCM 24511]|nr:hypothetical protein JCM24511_08149 [Saitozyma sp. JCM 24511]